MRSEGLLTRFHVSVAVVILWGMLSCGHASIEVPKWASNLGPELTRCEMSGYLHTNEGALVEGTIDVM